MRHFEPKIQFNILPRKSEIHYVYITELNKLKINISKINISNHKRQYHYVFNLSSGNDLAYFVHPDVKQDDCHTTVVGFLFPECLLSNLLQQYLSFHTSKPLSSTALNIREQTHNPNSESWNSGLVNENSPTEKKTIIFHPK